MKRYSIIAFTIVFFALSIITTFESLNMPARHKNSQNYAKELISPSFRPASAESSEQLTKEKIANEVSADKEQINITILEDTFPDNPEETWTHSQPNSTRAYREKKLFIPLISSPEGARVLLDERQRGFTPLTLKLVYMSDAGGSHSDETRKRTITIEKEGYESYALIFSVNGKEYKSIPNIIPLKKLFYSVRHVDSYTKEPAKAENAKKEENSQTIEQTNMVAYLSASDTVLKPDVSYGNEIKIIEGSHIAGKKTTADTAGSLFNIQRVITAGSIKNREPVKITDTFPSSTQKVYCFLEAIDVIRDSKVSFTWYFEEKAVARVYLPLKRSRRWRTYSSKLINGNRGDWNVVLQNGSGAVIASLEFTVK